MRGRKEATEAKRQIFEADPMIFLFMLNKKKRKERLDSDDWVLAEGLDSLLECLRVSVARKYMRRTDNMACQAGGSLH